MFPALAGGFLTTVPPGKSLNFFFSLKFSSSLILSTLNCSLCLYFFRTPSRASIICLPLSSISRGPDFTCFALSFCFPLHGLSHLLPWLQGPPAHLWFPNPHLKSRSCIQIHLSTVSWMCHGILRFSMPVMELLFVPLAQICFSSSTIPPAA